jgi:hypothetical protein
MKGIIRFISVLMFVCAVVPAAGAQEEYQTEVSALYDRYESGQDFRITSYGAAAEIFFAPVNTTDHPYAEAAFLERIGSVGVMVQKQEWKLFSVDASGPQFGIGLNYAQPDFPLVIRAEYSTTTLDVDAPGVEDVKVNTYTLGVGNYFTKTLLVGIDYDFVKVEYPGGLGTSKMSSYGLFAKYVHELEHHRELSFEARLSRDTLDDGAEDFSNTAEELFVDYYFNKSLSLGAGIANSSGEEESAEGQTYSARARYFFTPQFSLEGYYDRFLNSNEGLEDDKAFGFALAARF